MAEKDAIVVVVLGYTCRLTDWIKSYLDEVVKFVAANNNVRTIITSGGYTSLKGNPDVSESGMMLRYLWHAFMKKGVAMMIIAENSSLTTSQNLRQVRKIIEEYKLNPSKIVIFCDSHMRLKVILLALLHLGGRPRLKTFKIRRPWWFTAYQYCLVMPVDVLGYFVPPLERLQMRLRKRSVKHR